MELGEIENKIIIIEHQIQLIKEIIKKNKKNNNDEGGGGPSSKPIIPSPWVEAVKKMPPILFFDDEEYNVDDMKKNVPNCESVLVKCSESESTKITMDQYISLFRTENDYTKINHYARMYKNQQPKEDEDSPDERKTIYFCSGITSKEDRLLHDWANKNSDRARGNTDKSPIIVFDWDKTLSVVEGIIIPKELPYSDSYNIRVNKKTYDKLNSEGLGIKEIVNVEEIANIDSDDEDSELPIIQMNRKVDEKIFIKDASEFLFGRLRRRLMISDIFTYIRDTHPNIKICILTRNSVASEKNKYRRNLFLKIIRTVDSDFEDKNLIYCPPNMDKSEVLKKNLEKIMRGGRFRKTERHIGKNSSGTKKVKK